jgi:hypothetical protein
MASEYGSYKDPRLSPAEGPICPECGQDLNIDDGEMWCECGYSERLEPDEDPRYNLDPYQEENW